MTTGRINQVTTVERRRWTVARGRRRRATTAFNTGLAQNTPKLLKHPLQLGSTREGKPFSVDKVYFDSRTVVEVQHESPENFQRFAQPPEPLGREGRARFTERARDPRGNPVHRLERSEAPTPEKRICRRPSDRPDGITSKTSENTWGKWQLALPH